MSRQTQKVSSGIKKLITGGGSVPQGHTKNAQHVENDRKLKMYELLENMTYHQYLTAATRKRQAFDLARNIPLIALGPEVLLVGGYFMLTSKD